ncbi:MAG: hypothetical protein RLZZ185_1087, partial [Bacteroidota bacterium]
DEHQTNAHKYQEKNQTATFEHAQVKLDEK